MIGQEAVLANDEFLVAIAQGRKVRDLPSPQTRRLRLGLRDRLRIWRWFVLPLGWFLGMFAGTFLALALLAMAILAQ